MLRLSTKVHAAPVCGCEYRLDKDRVLPIFDYVFQALALIRGCRIGARKRS
jgi:hypothetical protein